MGIEKKDIHMWKLPKTEQQPDFRFTHMQKGVWGDPLIPRPIDNYITIQEVMDTHHVDHKTIMKIVRENNLENHLTIRNRYLKKSEIIPAIINYKKRSLQHQNLINRYRTGS